MMLLGDGNDLVQDAASKGLGIVYEACSAEQRDAMVGNLLQTLLEGNKGTQKVDKDSKIFGEGQLGKAPTGENLTTYKELCSLASDLNQPDLVYKFMNLANHNAIWNSLVKDTTKTVDKYLEEILKEVLNNLTSNQW